MDEGEIVKTCVLWLKDFSGIKIHKNGGRLCEKLTFNCSEALLFAGQSVFYT